MPRLKEIYDLWKRRWMVMLSGGGENRKLEDTLALSVDICEQVEYLLTSAT